MQGFEIVPARTAGDLYDVTSTIGRVNCATYPGTANGITDEVLRNHFCAEWAIDKALGWHDAVLGGATLYMIRHNSEITGYSLPISTWPGGPTGMLAKYHRHPICMNAVLQTFKDPGDQDQRDLYFTAVPNTPVIAMYDRTFKRTNRDNTSEWPILKGGHPLPQIEYVTTPETRRVMVERISGLLSKRGWLIAPTP